MNDIDRFFNFMGLASIYMINANEITLLFNEMGFDTDITDIFSEFLKWKILN